MKYLPLLIILLFFFNAKAQIKLPNRSIPRDTLNGDSINFKESFLKQQKQLKKDTVKITDYRVISFERDTTSIDTTLTIKKDYKYNYLRRDDFELLPFSNVGQPYNALGRDFNVKSLYPALGAVAKNQKYIETEGISYYSVPTPLTELTFKTTFEQGQFLDALLTLNTSPRLNVSIAFNGFRSLGKYQFNQSESGIFRTTFNYRTKNNKYWIRGHYASQDIETEENGGITEKELQFESGDEDFLERSRIEVAYTDADNRILGKRYFFDHQYNLVKPKRDSLGSSSTMLAIGHKFSYESKFYQFNQDSESDTFGSSFNTSIVDKSSLKTTFNEVSAQFSNNTLGTLSANLSLYNYDYFFNTILITEEGAIPNRLNGEEVSLGADYKNKVGPLELYGKFRYNLSGELAGNLIDAKAIYNLNDTFSINASVHASSKAPNFNLLLYQSDYENFNWENNFDRQQVQTLSFGFDSKKFGTLNASYSSIDNYAHFRLNDAITQEDIEAGNQNAFVRAFQEEETINHLKIKYQKEFKWRNWSLDNTLMYQEVDQTNQVLNVPEFVTRNTIYYSNDVFKKAMYIQTGVSFKYFTSYNLDAYHPLLGEFYTQNIEELGNFPVLDFFINAKVRQTRIFLKAEHLNTIWTKQYNFYSAPNYPYRDFVIRFGVVWNFFS